MQIGKQINVFRDTEPVIIPWVLSFEPCPSDWKIPNIDHWAIRRVVHYPDRDYNFNQGDPYYMMHSVYDRIQSSIKRSMEYETSKTS